MQKSSLNILFLLLCFTDKRKSFTFGTTWGFNTHKWVQHKWGHLKAIDELSSLVKLFFEVKIEQRLKIETPWLFSQTFILVEQTIHRSEDFPLTDVVLRLRSFFSQHEPDLHEICLFVCLFQKGILSYHSFRLAENTSCKLCLPPGVHCFAITLFSRTRVTHHCWEAWANRIADFPSAYWLPMSDDVLYVAWFSSRLSVFDLQEGPSTSPHTAMCTRPQ